MNICYKLKWNVFKPGAIVKLAIALIIIFSSCYGFAELDFSPYVQLQETYNSNVFSSPDGGSDYTTIGSVGFNLIVDDTDYNINFNYQLDQLWYDKNKGEDVTYHTLATEAGWEVSRDFQLFFSETFLKTAEPASAELTGREDRINNTASVRGELKVRKTAYELGYSNSYETYDTVDTRDSRVDIVSGVFNYYHHWDLSMFVWYDHGWINYDEEGRSDGDFDEATAGVKGNLARRTTGQARAGYRWQNYDDKDRESFSGPTLYVNINHDFPGRSAVVAFATRTVEESFFEGNIYYEVIAGGVELTHTISDMFSVSVQGSYQRDDYPVAALKDGISTKREDEIYSGSANLGVDLGKGVTASLNYGYTDNSSNFPENEFTGHRITVQARFTL